MENALSCEQVGRTEAVTAQRFKEIAKLQMFGKFETVISGSQYLKGAYEGALAHRLLGAVCGESRTYRSVGEVHHSNVDIDSNKMGQPYSEITSAWRRG